MRFVSLQIFEFSTERTRKTCLEQTSRVHLLVYLLDEITSFVRAVLFILLLYVFVSCASCFLSMCCGFFFFPGAVRERLRKHASCFCANMKRKEMEIVLSKRGFVV